MNVLGKFCVNCTFAAIVLLSAITAIVLIWTLAI